MKKLTALLLCLMLVMSSMTVAFAAGITPDQQLNGIVTDDGEGNTITIDIKANNTRTEPVPRDGSGVIQWTGKWDTNYSYFNGEADDGSIQRTAYYSATGDHDWYLSFLYFEGGGFAFRPGNTTTPENAECYLQWDFGIATYLDEIEFYYDNTWGTYDQIPVDVKFAYSDDGKNWTDVVMPAYDLTKAATLENYGYDSATAKAMADAYAKYIAGNELTDAEKELLNDTVTYTLKTKSRYLRYYPLDNGQQHYEDNGGTNIRIPQIKMYDYSAPWDGKGEGTQADPYLIENEDDFASFANYVNNGWTYAGKYIKLTADISVGEEQQVGEGGDNNDVYKNPFSGTFDGDGHTITYTNTDNEYEYGGVFYAVTGTQDKHAVIKNLNVTGELKGAKWLAGVVGYGNYADIINCTSSVAISNLHWQYLAGIAGQLYNSTVTDCTNNGILTCDVWTSGYDGGIVGWAENCTITGCKNTAAHHFYGDGNNGGIVGWANNCTVADCENSGKLDFNGSKANNGGIVGWTQNTTVIESVNTAVLEYNNTSGTNPAAGGIVGGTGGAVTLLRCGNEGDITHNNGNWEIGMIFGLANNGTVDVDDCYNLGSGNVGGFFGRAIGGSSITIDNSYSMATTYNNGNGKAAIDYISTDSGTATFTNCYAVYTGEGTVSAADGITVKASVADFATLATALNNGRSKTVWTDGENGYPVFATETEETVETTATISAVDDTTVTYTVTLADENAIVIVALYNGNDLVAVKTNVEAGADKTVTLDKAEGETVTNAKIFVWESLATAKPITLGEYTLGE